MVAPPTSAANWAGPAAVGLLPTIHHRESRKASAAIAAVHPTTPASTARRCTPYSGVELWMIRPGQDEESKHPAGSEAHCQQRHRQGVPLPNSLIAEHRHAKHSTSDRSGNQRMTAYLAHERPIDPGQHEQP